MGWLQQMIGVVGSVSIPLYGLCGPAIVTKWE